MPPLSALSSTKNGSGTRDPEMHQMKKGNTWLFGMKAHIGAERDSGLADTVVGTDGNVCDVTVGNVLMHGQEAYVVADAGFEGADNATRAGWHLAMRPSVGRRSQKQPLFGKLLDYVDRVKAAVRAKVEYPFRTVKNRMGRKKMRYRGLAKSTTQLVTLFVMADLLLAERRLFELHARGTS
jgi:IS5 family transposase